MRRGQSPTSAGDSQAPMIQLRSVTKRYREGNESRTVIQQANAEIFRGEFAALAGPSGSGKTTLLNIISGIDTPSGGDVLVDSVPITTLSEKRRTLFRRKNVGFVFQFFNLIPTLSVRENLLLPMQLNEFNRTISDERVSELLDGVGMLDRIDSYPDRISGGEKQRVAIARALVHDPQLILADEPTGNLDADTGRSVMDLLQNLVQKGNKTLLVVSHSDEVVSRASRVFSIEEGRLIEMRHKASNSTPSHHLASEDTRSTSQDQQ